METMKNRLAFIMIAFIVYGCASSVKRGEEEYFEPPLPSTDKAQIIMFWPHQHRLSNFVVGIYINGDKITELVNDTYHYIDLAPATYDIEVKDPGVVGQISGGPKARVTLDAGERIYLRVRNVTRSSTSYSTVGGMVYMSPSVEGELELNLEKDPHPQLQHCNKAVPRY